ncbi:MAG TPA: hypothetical protein PKA63_14640 [Oligoflexia bacterium]|nr:hypothetical protein [Oligoflexia bacterium]HMP49903.1 hypothetical protein [Oligoflexia bacterium]
MKFCEFVSALRGGWTASEIMAYQAMVREEEAVMAPRFDTTPEAAVASGEVSEKLAELESEVYSDFVVRDFRRTRVIDLGFETRLCKKKKGRNLGKRKIAKQAFIRRERKAKRRIEA